MRTGVLLFPLVALFSFIACEDSGTTTRASASATDDDGSGADSGKKTTKKDAGKTSSSTDAEAPVDCPSFASAVSRGILDRAYVPECSGLAASHAHPGVLWAHNDSPDAGVDQKKIFAISATDGHTLGVFSVAGGFNDDWEDIAIDYTSNEIYVADIGDNAAFDGKKGRSSIALYHFPEPDIEDTAPDSGPLKTGSVTATKIVMTYPDGAHNAESFGIDSATHEGYVFSKMKDGTSTPYKIDLKAASPVTLTKLTTRDLKVSKAEAGIATGASIGDTGILLRTYTGVFLFPRLSGDTVADMWGRVPCVLDAPKMTQEVQAEAIAWSADEKGFFTTTEAPSDFINQPLDYSAKK